MNKSYIHTLIHSHYHDDPVLDNNEHILLSSLELKVLIHNFAHENCITCDTIPRTDELSLMIYHQCRTIGKLRIPMTSQKYQLLVTKVYFIQKGKI